MNDTIMVAYARKANTLSEVRAFAFGSNARATKTKIVETKNLSAEEYDAFINDLLVSHEWLAGKGGSENGIATAVEITAPERITFYVNPEGYDYARYVGFELPPANATKYPDVHVHLIGKNGNAFNVLGNCKRAARQAGVPEDQIAAFLDEATSGNYDQLLATCMRWFDCH